MGLIFIKNIWLVCLLESETSEVDISNLKMTLISCKISNEVCDRLL